MPPTLAPREADKEDYSSSQGLSPKIKYHVKGQGQVSRPFIISDGAKKTDPQTRKLIRSFVMRGKNRGKNRQSKPEDPDTAARVARLIICRKVGTDMGFFPFADTIAPKVAAEALNSAITVAKARYVLNTCLIFTDLGTAWIRQLAVDESFLQSFILMCQLYFDFARGNNTSYDSQVSVLKTIQLLREKLSLEDRDSQVSDPTLFVVLNLAVHAFIHGDDKSSRHHLSGIRRMVDLRGGITKVTETKMLLELLRCDLSLTLHTGAKPLFFSEEHDDLFSHPLLQYPPELELSEEMNILFDGLDEGLLTAWEATKSFCSLINLAIEGRGRIPWTSYLNTMAPVMYRLLHMSFKNGSFNEAIRLGLLVFCSQIFLQWEVVTMTHAHLLAAYEACLSRLEGLKTVPPHLLAWLLMIGAISTVRTIDDEIWMCQLKPCLLACKVSSWIDIRESLESFLWIGIVQNKPGKDVFDSTMSKNDINQVQ